MVLLFSPIAYNGTMQSKFERKIEVPFWWLVIWIFLVTSFCTVGFLLVSRAIGYRYNFNIDRWQKTAMIVISADPRGSLLTVDGQQYEINQNTRVPNLLPGTYRLKLTRDGYQPWETATTINSGYVMNFEPVTLFLDQPIDVAVSEGTAAQLANPPVNDEIRIVDGEIWRGTHFVSRFATAPTNAILLSTDRHVLYSLGNQIRVVDINGEHDWFIYQRSTTDPTPLVQVDDQTIGFYDAGAPKVLQIR